MLRLILQVTTAFAVLLSANAGLAEAPSSTLKRITDSGVIRIGYAVDDSPFSYIDKGVEPIGYSIDLCKSVVDLLKQSLNLSELKIDYVKRTPSDRVALLKDGSIDLECVASTNNAERRKSVGFSYSHFVTVTQFVSLKSSNLTTIDELAGRTVTSTSGTVNIGQLSTVNRERGLHIAVVPSESQKTAFSMMRDGRASAFVMDGILLAAMIANADDPEKYSLSTDAFGTSEPYGLMMRRDDVEFKTAINDALSQIFKSGEIKGIYDKWFMSPIPPQGVNLRLPVSEALQKAFLTPSELSGE